MSLVNGLLAPRDSGTSLYVRKVADETVNNSAFPQNDDELVLAVEADKAYLIEGFIRYTSNSTADFKTGWSVPSGSTFDWSPHGLSRSGTAFEGDGSFGAPDATGTPQFGGTGGVVSVSLRGLLVVGDTAGDLQFQWAQKTADVSDTIVLAGSWLTLTPLVAAPLG